MALAQGGKSRLAQSCPPSEARTWLNPTEMRQSLAPIQSSRESLLFSCPGTLCKAHSRPAISTATAHTVQDHAVCTATA